MRGKRVIEKSGDEEESRAGRQRQGSPGGALQGDGAPGRLGCTSSVTSVEAESQVRSARLLEASSKMATRED